MIDQRNLKWKSSFGEIKVIETKVKEESYKNGKINDKKNTGRGIKGQAHSFLWKEQ